jgi:DNA-directed RNA polymerase specialized sigma24 family protein
MDLEQIAPADWRKQATIQADFDQLRRALGSLKPERALVLYLHDVEGHRLADIGVMLGSSVAAVQSLLVRGRTQLYERYRLLEPSGLQPARSELKDTEPQDSELGNRERSKPKAGNVL